MARRDRIKWERTEDWWEFKPFMSRELKNDWVPRAIELLVYHPDADPDDPDSQIYTIDPNKIQEYLDHQYQLVLAVTTGWSFGPVDLETLNSEVDAEYLDEMIIKCSEFIPPLVPSGESNLHRIYS